MEQKDSEIKEWIIRELPHASNGCGRSPYPQQYARWPTSPGWMRR
jgi:hypothetical protein